MARTLDIRPRAAVDVVRITAHIARRISSESAFRWRNEIERRIGDLSQDAERSPEADEAAELPIPLRVKLSGKRPHVYRIYFTYNEDSVTVHRVLHAAQDRLTEDDL